MEEDKKFVATIQREDGSQFKVVLANHQQLIGCIGGAVENGRQLINVELQEK